MRKIKIYLAGAISGLTYEQMNTWRNDVSEAIKSAASYKDCFANIINPVDFYNFQNPRHQSEREIMKYDIAHVKSSDLVVVKLERLNGSIGSCIELYEAYKCDIPIIGLGTEDEYCALHPWIKECITRYEKNHSETAGYIRDFYMT